MRIFLLIILLLSHPMAYAFELFPMVSFFSPKGSKSEQFFQVNNTTEQALPLEVFVKQRQISASDTELLADTEDFFVFPPQVLIPPKSTQMVKVKYIGNLVDTSQSYRVVFSQLPIKDEVKQSSIKMLFQIGALVFVSPDNVANTISADIHYQANTPTSMKLANTGDGVVIIPQLSFEVTSDHARHSWKWQDIQHLLNQQYLVPGESVDIAMDTLLSPKDSQAKVDIKENR
ncbi:fimbria/pilus periplasmic chaperone [Shewanella sp. Isolate13]|uniref:fimbria/pilus periplasmic chaperone n=1 Tax=Shewanella sp. Isolate13 TaxID=2908531 RepID=UPI001EFE57CB|nr:fimbria/pilus periplasmic chaperone [Shewanella sp. Isolate13]MCG9730838.1 fimbria/pilus periplasmic chaperone [Shewanella sp. Isolate13]